MALDKNDLKAIEKIVEKTVDKRVGKSEEYLKDLVEFSIERTEQKFEARFDKIDKKFDKIDDRFDQIDKRFDRVDREIGDLIKTNQHFLKIFDNHEKRIIHVETKLNIKPVKLILS